MNKEFEFLNIPKWHKAGYTGKGVKIRLIDEFEDHIDVIQDIQKVVAPDADFKVYPITMTGIKQAEEDDPDILIVSLSEFYGAYPYIKRMIEKGTMVFKSAGNDGDKGESGFTFPQKSIFVAAYKLINGKVVKTAYTSHGRGWVDIASLSNFVIDGKKVYGTSFAGPLAAYMYALMVQKYKHAYGVRPSFENGSQFLIDNSVDLEEPGKDLKSGHGLFMLPNDMDLSKYAPKEVNEMQPERITDMNKLHWKARKVIQKAIDNTNSLINKPGVEIRVFETVRTYELQEHYYKIGASRSKVPTFHRIDVGLAADIAVYVNGQPTWHDDYQWAYDLWGREAVKLGLTWGGNWESIVDKPHVQLDDGLKSSDIRNGKRPDWFDDIDPELYSNDFSNRWAAGHIQFCLDHGLMKGYEDGTFKPTKPLTREEMAIILAEQNGYKKEV